MAKRIQGPGDTIRKQLNQKLEELSRIQADIETAKNGGVKGIEICDDACKKAQQDIMRLKQAYYPNHP